MHAPREFAREKWFKLERMKWKILKQDGNEFELVSESILPRFNLIELDPKLEIEYGDYINAYFSSGIANHLNEVVNDIFYFNSEYLLEKRIPIKEDGELVCERAFKTGMITKKEKELLKDEIYTPISEYAMYLGSPYYIKDGKFYSYYCYFDEENDIIRCDEIEGYNDDIKNHFPDLYLRPTIKVRLA